MSSVVFRPLVDGEESLFDSLPDLLPLRQISYAEGLAGGGFHPSRTWVALREGRVVARAAWVLPPGAVGGPWLERFDVIDSPQVGAGLLAAAHEALGGPRPYYAALPAGWHTSPSVVSAVAPALAAAESAGLVPTGERLRLRWVPGAGADRPAAAGPAVRPAAGPHEIDTLVGRVVSPDVLTGSETARAVAGLDLATDPRPWLTGEATAWHVAHDGGEPLGLLGTAGQACWPMLGYLGALPGPRTQEVRSALVDAALRVLVADGAEEVVADADADRSDVLADLGRADFRPIRARLTFEPGNA
ncbi:acetyltransferase [Actinoplanes sp. M2I2]|uniref:acetyltransferase n=1 Tax=Actinoplanes sp. M2I2 TaxID=1734444 RepID=UPI00201FC0D5|nr:acetyltransferase [Actinoplanes sp. M2I2]